MKPAISSKRGIVSKITHSFPTTCLRGSLQTISVNRHKSLDVAAPPLFFAFDFPKKKLVE